MRHSVYGRKLGRNKNQRTALFKGLVRSLILEGSIKTTEPKAKAIKGLVDRLVTQGKKNNNASINMIRSFLTHQLVADKLIKEIAPRFTNRPSGFTSIVRLGARKGDGAMVVKMSWVEGEKQSTEKAVVGNPKTEVKPRRVKKETKK